MAVWSPKILDIIPKIFRFIVTSDKEKLQKGNLDFLLEILPLTSDSLSEWLQINFLSIDLSINRLISCSVNSHILASTEI